jgi:hypothetical protein
MRRSYPRFSNAALTPTKPAAPANDNAASGEMPPSGTRPITRYSDDALRNLLANYNTRGVTEGGIFSRQEVQMELFRRDCFPFDGYTIVALIKDLAKASENGFVTYQTLWRALNPNDAGWGPYAIRQCMKAMGAANYFCARANLPFVATLIVCAGTSTWSEQAVHAIASTAEMLGVLTPETADDFVLNEAVKSLNFVA